MALTQRTGPLLTLASAVVLETPAGQWYSGASASISWSSQAGDPATFSLELANNIFHDAYAIANNVPTSEGSATFILPIVPTGDGYVVNAVAVNNINVVYAHTGEFAIE